MAAPTTVPEGQLLTKDTSEVFKYTFDYDVILPVGVILASVGTFTITPSGELTQSNQALVAGNRKATVYLTGGVYGKTYTIEHTVQTNESPAQTYSPWFKLRIK
jgi:hypothetical protein